MARANSRFRHARTQGAFDDHGGEEQVGEGRRQPESVLHPHEDVRQDQRESDGDEDESLSRPAAPP